MNGRVFAVNRSPVLAWNVEVPYSEMPAAAAAAISPIVPTASDPYGRCWQNQVDPGSSFPYFGALSLPPTAYRLQPGCMPNLGQFWPPTPPPDGCGRFNENNLYFGPPVLRHGENISSNMRSSFQSLSHFSHLVETPKETTQRVFKQESALSPNVSSCNVSKCSSASKSDNLNACCVVESKNKTQSSVSHSLPKQDLLTVSSGQEPYFFAPDIRSSSNLHPSTDKSCFSSAYSLKGNVSIHSPPQENIHHKVKSQPGTQESNCNASPLKNVYFSHYESENVNSVNCKNYDKSSEEQFYSDRKHLSLNSNKPKSTHHQPLSDYHLGNHHSKKYDYLGAQDVQNKPAPSQRNSDTSSIKEHYKQKHIYTKIKPEKLNPYDCKYQRNLSQNNPGVIQIPESKSSDLLNMSTSVIYPKSEPKDKYFMPSCSSNASSCVAPSYANSSSSYLMSTSSPRTTVSSSSPFLVTNSSPRTPVSSSSPFIVTNNLSRTPGGNSSPFLACSSSSRTPLSNYQSSIYQNSCSVNKSWPYNELPLISPDNYFKSPEPAKPPSQNFQTHASSALHEDLISVAQTAPPEMQITREENLSSGFSQTRSFSMHPKKPVYEEDDDEVQIIAVQTKSTSKLLGKQSSEKFVENQFNQKSSNFVSPLYLKTEKIEEKSSDCLSTSPDKSLNDIPPQLEEQKCIYDEGLKQSDFDDKTDLTTKNDKPHDEIPCLTAMETRTSDISTVHIKKECDEEKSITSIDNNVVNESVSSLDKTPLIHPETVDEKVDVSHLDPPPIKELESSSDAITSICEDPKPQEFKEFNEHHGLNLLLDTIEKVTSLETSASNSTSTPAARDVSEISCKVKTSSPSPNVLKTRGLELLSSIAVERLVSEFDVIKTEPKEDFSVSSNYPQIKEENKQALEDDLQKQSDDVAVKTPSSVFEMRDKLLELQKKYKQKQKELSRLKPKKRFANIYMNCQHKTSGEVSDQASVSNSDLSSLCSNQDLRAESAPEESFVECKLKTEPKDLNTRPKRNQRLAAFKKESSVEILSEEEVQEVSVQTRITRRTSGKNCVKLKRPITNKKETTSAMHSKSIKHVQRKRFSKFRKKQEQTVETASDEQLCSSVKSNSLPENYKKSKVYSLRQSSSQVSVKMEDTSGDLISNSRAISSKRKSINPKRYVPSKQGKMSETIVAKHLRNRILFDTSGSISEEENIKQEGDSIDLYDEMMNCHLSNDKKRSLSDDEGSDMSSENLLGYPEPSKLKPENLIERQRLLALEEGLFYAGCIKECHSSNRFGIALDGQRGNKLHHFSREELLSQTIVESKPVTPELPKGTRVCAYWSQQYRCLYPGVIGKAPCPSADWSEPRVFVQFDDGDSGQIPTKNVRLIPPDIIPPGSESRVEDSNASGSHSDLKRKQGSTDPIPRRLRSSTPKKKHKGNDNESKDSSSTSVNDSSCDECFRDFSLSPSQNFETENSPSNTVNPCKLEKRQRKHSKRKVTSRTKSVRDEDCPDKKGKGDTKIRRHKKNKDKHHRHHHHRHRRHHHHRHHHHSKKRKHRRKTGKSPSSQDDDNSIPCKSNLKSSCKSFEVESTDLIEHSNTTIHLPQSEQ